MKRNDKRLLMKKKQRRQRNAQNDKRRSRIKRRRTNLRMMTMLETATRVEIPLETQSSRERNHSEKTRMYSINCSSPSYTMHR